MRTVKSKPGISHKDALLSLQRHARASNEEIVSFLRRGDRWVAQLQKAAEFPPAEVDDEKEPPKDEGPPKDDAPKGPPTDPDGDGDGDSTPEGDTDHDEGSGIPGLDKPEGEKSEKSELHELVALVPLIHQIAEKMGIVPAGHEDKLMGDGGPTPPPPPGPPAPAGPDAGPDPGPDLGSAGKGGQLPTKLHPGDVLPHQTPVGAPAFASVRQAEMLPGGNPVAAPAAAPASPPCSKCGGPTVGGVCPACTSAAGAVQAAVSDPNGVVGKKRTLTAKVDQPMAEVEAFRQASAAFGPYGYSVKQLVPQADGTWLAVLEG